MEQAAVSPDSTSDSPSAPGSATGESNANQNQTKGKGKGKGGKGNKSGKGKKGQNREQVEEMMCVLCAETIDFRSRLSVLAPCGHNDMCSTCALRLRILHKDKRCPCCNIEAEMMVATPTSKLNHWSDIDIDETNKRSAKWSGGTFQKHNESSLYMPHSFKVSHVDKLISCTCYENIPLPPPTPPSTTLSTTLSTTSIDGALLPPGLTPPQPPLHVPTTQKNNNNIKNKKHVKCLANFGNLKSLGKHLREKHNLQFCSICVEHKPVFCSELKRYSISNDELEKHITIGDPKGEGFSGHPKCSWCKERFYDEKALTLHYTKNHFCCHLCDRLGVANKWFRDYAGLDAHYSKDHWPCHDPKCKERRFVAFEDEFQLRLHQQDVHRQVNSRKQNTNAIVFNYSNNHNSGSGIHDDDDIPSSSQMQQQMQSENGVLDLSSNTNAFPTLGESLTEPQLLTDDCSHLDSSGGGGGGGGDSTTAFVPFGRWGDGARNSTNPIANPIEAFPTLASTTTPSSSSSSSSRPSTSTTSKGKGKWGGKGGKGSPHHHQQQQTQPVSWASSRSPNDSTPDRAADSGNAHTGAHAAALAMAAEFSSSQQQQSNRTNKPPPPPSHDSADDYPSLGGSSSSSSSSGAGVKKSKAKSKTAAKSGGGVLSKLGIPAAGTGMKKPSKPATGLSLVRNSAVKKGKL